MPRHSHDTHDFYTVLRDFPDQFWKALECAKGVVFDVKPEQVLISGMGGSALPGDIVDTYLRGELPVYMNRDYGVPHWVDARTGVFCISYSGNTEETVESFLDALDRGARICVITSGGQLLDLAQKHSVPHVVIPGGLQPRCATGYLFGAIIAVLAQSGLIEKAHLDRMREMSAELATMDLETDARTIAKDLKDHVPVIYASERFHSLARIWKIKINENAKTQAFHNAFPELNHNEMVGFTNLIMKPYVVFLHHQGDHERVKKRMAITKDVLMNNGIPVREILMHGTSLISNIFSTLWLGDWISYYLSELYTVDPTNIDMVEDFKERMKQ